MKPPEILLVDDDPGMIQVMARALRDLGRLRFATSGEQALSHMADAAPDLVLLDADMPGLNGFQVCRRMKEQPHLADVPVIFVTGYSSTEDELRGLEAGASDFISKPVSEPLLVARACTQLRVKALTDRLRAVAVTDALTGVANRRSFDEALPLEWARAHRTGQPLSLLMVDVDHFKAYNDCYGHPGGDECLRNVGSAMGLALRRPTDLLTRYGGEEFAALLPATDLAGAEDVAARIHSALQAAALPHARSTTAAHVTVSIGIGLYLPGALAASAAGSPPDGNELTRVADEALYAAKQSGRSCTWHFDLSTREPARSTGGATAPLLKAAA